MQRLNYINQINHVMQSLEHSNLYSKLFAQTSLLHLHNNETFLCLEHYKCVNSSENIDSVRGPKN